MRETAERSVRKFAEKAAVRVKNRSGGSAYLPERRLQLPHNPFRRLTPPRSPKGDSKGLSTPPRRPLFLGKLSRLRDERGKTPQPAGWHYID